MLHSDRLDLVTGRKTWSSSYRLKRVALNEWMSKQRRAHAPGRADALREVDGLRDTLAIVHRNIVHLHRLSSNSSTVGVSWPATTNRLLLH